MSHLDAIAHKCFQDEIWHEQWKAARRNGALGGLPPIFVVVLAFHLVVIPRDFLYGLFASLVITVNSAWFYWHFEEEMYNLTSSIAAALKSRFEVPRRMQAFHSLDPEFVLRVCTFAVNEYREQITVESQRVLGEGSRWARTREEVSGASDGASETVAYWNDRLRQEPSNQEARERLDAGSRLYEKVALELRVLEEYAKAVEKACDECRDQVDGIEQRVRDVEQIQQIGKASVAAATEQALADESVRQIAKELYEEAEAVGVALADISRLEVSAIQAPVGDCVEQMVGEAFEESEPVAKVSVGSDLTMERPPPSAGVTPAQPEVPPEQAPPTVEMPRVTPIRPRQLRDRIRSTAREMPARTSKATEDRQMKELVVSLRRMAEIQERRAHDLRFRDDLNSEADDRDDLAEKMTELADEIEIFFTVKERMKDWRPQTP